MTARSAWTAGNGQGLVYGPVFGAEITALANGAVALSSIAVTNGTALDQFMDVSIEAKTASGSLAAGAGMVVWIMYLQGDGVTYGDGSFALGATGAAAAAPAVVPAVSIPLRSGITGTAWVGSNASPVVLEPGTFALALQNNTGFTLSGCTGYYRTYNQNLNN